MIVVEEAKMGEDEDADFITTNIRILNFDQAYSEEVKNDNVWEATVGDIQYKPNPEYINCPSLIPTYFRTRQDKIGFQNK